VEPDRRNRSRTGRLFLYGFALLLLGIPFLGASFMAFMLSGGLAAGIPASIAVLAAVFVLSGFQGALVAVFVAAALAVSYRLGKGIGSASAVASASAMVAALLGAGYAPGFMMLSSAELEPLVPVYTAAGFSQQDISGLFGIVDYLSPSIGALQLAGGAILAAFFAAALLSSRKGWSAGAERRFELGFTVVWTVIACLLLNVLGSRADAVHPEAVRMARNVLTFLLLPSSILGWIVARSYLRLAPQMLIPGVLVMAFLPPVFILGLAMLGILDVWFDFRTRIDARIERSKNEGTAG
jgi:hypothetical protein